MRIEVHPGKAGADKQGHESHRQCDKGNTGRTRKGRESRDRAVEKSLRAWVKNCTRKIATATVSGSGRNGATRTKIMCKISARTTFDEIEKST